MEFFKFYAIMKKTVWVPATRKETCMKKILCLCLIGTLLAITLTACGSTIYDDWKMDQENHWKLSESGERVDISAHQLEGNTCTVCGAKITMDSNTVDVKRENENEDTVHWICYDNDDGSVLFDKTYSHEYKDNVKTSTKEYEDGKLALETTYEVSPLDGEIYESTQSYFNEDGSKEYMEFNEYGEMLKEIIHAPDGSLVMEGLYEFKYDGAGQKTYHKYTVDGVVTEECEYKYDEQKSFTYEAKKTEYNPDGSKTVTEYNEDGTVHRKYEYDANGNKVE